MSRTPGRWTSRSADSQQAIGDTETKGWRIVGEKVRREKALDFSGCKSRPGTGRSTR